MVLQDGQVVLNAPSLKYQAQLRFCKILVGDLKLSKWREKSG